MVLVASEQQITSSSFKSEANTGAGISHEEARPAKRTGTVRENSPAACTVQLTRKNAHRQQLSVVILHKNNVYQLKET